MQSTSWQFRLWVVAFLLSLPLAGPALAAVDQWSQIGPFGGPVTAVVFHPGDHRIAYAATYTNGVFRSTDGGQSWAPSNIGLPRRNVASLAVAPGSPPTLYATAYGPLAKSTDGGATWTETGLDSVALLVAVSPARPDTVVVLSGDRRLRRSDDGGATWRDLPLPAEVLSFPGFLTLDPRTPDTLYLGVQGSIFSAVPRGLYQTTDAGATWRRLETSLTLPEESSTLGYTLAVAPDRPDTLYASIFDDSFPIRSRLARSTDAGTTWTPLPGPGGHPVLALPGGRVVTDRGVSTDAGETWETHTPPTMRVAALAAHPARPGDVLLGARYRGIYRSADGGTSWVPSSRGMTATQIEALAVGSDSTIYAGATGDGLFTSGNGGDDWQRLELPARSPDDFTWVRRLSVHPRRPRLLYAGLSSAFADDLVRTDNGGASFVDLGPLPSGQLLTDLAFDPASPDTVFASSLGDFPAGTCKSFRSTDRGNTWRCLRLGQAIDLEVDPIDPKNVYGINVRVSKSTDRGNTWTPQGYNRGLPAGSTPFTLVHAPSATGHLYLSSDRGAVFRTVDGGRNWKDVTGNLPRSAYKSLAVDPRNPAVVYAALSGVGVYRSKNGGRRWQILNRGLSGNLVSGVFGRPTPLAVDPRDPSTIYLGTNNRGVYAITLTN